MTPHKFKGQITGYDDTCEECGFSHKAAWHVWEKEGPPMLAYINTIVCGECKHGLQVNPLYTYATTTKNATSNRNVFCSNLRCSEYMIKYEFALRHQMVRFVDNGGKEDATEA